MSEPLTATATGAAPSAPAELERSTRELVAISHSLLESYGELSRRAERVESELELANRDLEAKVGELDEVKRSLEAILEALPIGVVVRASDGAVSRINGAALAILGLAPQAWIGRCERIVPCDDAAPDGSVPWLRPDGERRMLSLIRSQVPGALGAPLGEVEIVEDRTELFALAERVHQMDKMAAVGTLAAGIAHEIRNPLSAVKGFAGLLLRPGAPADKARGWAEKIVEGAAECDAIITNLLSFAAPERLALEAVDALALLEAARDQAMAGLPAPERWTIELSADAPRFRGDRVKLRQAVRNLLANALQAQPEGGRVRAALTLARGRIQVRVNDAGPGIPPELRAHVLEPFFTTRPEGTGLGLALVHTIARLHGGELSISPSPGPLGGADIRIVIPFSQVG